MVSVAEQLAANLTFSALAKSKELKKRIWFTLGALLVYRFGTYIPLPGIDPSVWDQIFQSQASGSLGIFNLLAGGGIHRMAIFALNVIPYISASIFIQLMATVSPTLAQLKKDGEWGPVMNQYTRYLTVVLAALQSYGIAVGLEGVGNVVSDPGWFFRISTVFTLTGGAVLIMWLAEQVTSCGIGKGAQLILFTGIIAEALSAIPKMFELDPRDVLLVGLILVGEVSVIVFMERAHRRLLIHTSGSHSHLSLKLNTSAELPPIAASSLLLLPAMVANFNEFEGSTLFASGRPLFLLTYVALIVFFTFFYTARAYDLTEVADNLKKEGSFIPRISPGERTAEYIDYVLTRITVVGAAYLAAVCVIPEILIYYTAVPFYLGGTDLFVAVSVPMNMIVQIQGLLATQHKGITKSKLGGRR